MRKNISCVLLLLSIAFHSAGWGPTGHRVTGWIAENHLSNQARKAIEKILKGPMPGDGRQVDDEIRFDSRYDYMTDWPLGHDIARADISGDG